MGLLLGLLLCGLHVRHNLVISAYLFRMLAFIAVEFFNLHAVNSGTMIELKLTFKRTW
jgi:hypothetical protein